MNTTTTKPESTVTFDGYNRLTNQARVTFYYPAGAEAYRSTPHNFTYSGLVRAVRENEAMRPILDAAMAAGLR